MESGYELFDHTADLGLRVWAPRAEDLIPPAVEALYAAVGRLDGEANAQPARLTLRASDDALALRDFLARLLFELERNRRILRGPHAVQFEGGLLVVEGEWAELDEAASEMLREVKAVTYHDLALTRTPDRCEARFIVDI